MFLNVYKAADVSILINRINKLTPDLKPLWGKMNTAQMLAHCNVTYEMIYENIYAKPGPLKKFFLKSFVKNVVINDKPYKHNNPTALEFKVAPTQDFEKEKARLIAYLDKTEKLGTSHFDGKESHSFGKLSISQWNNMMSKHLEHHLQQFGV